MEETEQFLSSLTIRWCADSAFRNTCKNVGVDPEDWPRVKARQLLINFETATNKKQAISEIMRSFPKLDFGSVPTDPEKLSDAYFEIMLEFRARAAAIELMQEPKRAAEIFEKLLRGAKKDPSYFSVDDVFDSEYEAFATRSLAKQTLIKIPGWENLSSMIGGFNPGRSAMLLAETGFGKTNFCLNLALAAKRIGRVVYINMEMLREDMMARIFVTASQSTWDEVRSGNIPLADYVKRRIPNEHKLIMSDGRDKSVQQIREAVRRFNMEDPVKLVIVDYDQKLLLKMDHGIQEWKALQTAFVELESMAKEIGCYVLISAQTSDKDGTVSGSNRAKFSCSTVLFFNDHEEYGTVIQVLKNRHGPRNKALTVEYDDKRASIKELEVISVGKSNGSAMGKRSKKISVTNYAVPFGPKTNL